jgi:hypothetical protein
VKDIALFGGGINGTYSSIVDIYNATSKIWTTSSLLVARYDLAASSVKDIVLFGGGYPFYYIALVEMYNTTSGTWSTSLLSQARNYLVATSVGDIALFGGGYNGTSVSSVIDIYDATSSMWTTALLSQGRCGLAATSVNEVVLFGGGCNSMDGYLCESWTNRVDIYYAANTTWTTYSLSLARYYLAATSVKDIALFGGGCVANSEPSECHSTSYVVDIYNTTSSEWLTARLFQPRSTLVAISVNNIVLFGGGFNDNQPVAYVDLYNATNSTWTTTTLSQSRGYLAASSMNDIALFSGGCYKDCEENSGQGSNVVDIYNATSTNWITTSLSQARSYPAATSCNNISLFGGGSGSSVVDLFVNVCTNNASCPDNGLFCDGYEVCVMGNCTHTGNPCSGHPTCNSTCNEDVDNCFAPVNTNCSDNVFCNGVDYCDGNGTCAHQGKPVTPLVCRSHISGNPCLGQTTCNSTCNEATHNCFAPTNTNCSDNMFCNGIDHCDGNGTCGIHAGKLLGVPN